MSTSTGEPVVGNTHNNEATDRSLESFDQVVKKKTSESDCLTALQQKELSSVLEKFEEVFANKPGRIKDYICKINVRPHKVFCKSSYPVPLSKRGQVTEEINQMLDWKVIEPYTQEDKIHNVMEALNESAQRRKTKYDSRINRNVEYHIGDLVLVKTHPQSSGIKKLNKKWKKCYEGPYEVASIPFSCSYWLVTPQTRDPKGLYPYKDLKKFVR